MGQGKMTSQLEFHRHSKEIAGNLANVVTEYEFKNGNGGTSRLWMPGLVFQICSVCVGLLILLRIIGR